jgi:hypothetical protein
MSTTISKPGPFDGPFDPTVFAAIFIPAVFLLIIILTMLVFLLYRQPTFYDNYITSMELENEDQSQADYKFEVISRTPLHYP